MILLVLFYLLLKVMITFRIFWIDRLWSFCFQYRQPKILGCQYSKEIRSLGDLFKIIIIYLITPSRYLCLCHWCLMPVKLTDFSITYSPSWKFAYTQFYEMWEGVKKSDNTTYLNLLLCDKLSFVWCCPW